ncbi:unnamed protein product, partial [Brenthis ino]
MSPKTRSLTQKYHIKHHVNLLLGCSVRKRRTKVLWTATGGAGYNCPYGQNCAFEPAPPGRAPACAQPGLTYCLHPEPYPEKVIRKLVEAGQYDIRTLLSDESRDDFDSNKKGSYPYGYGPNSLPHVDQISLVDDSLYHKDYNTKFNNKYNHDVYSEKTPLQPPYIAGPTPYNIKAYQASNYSKFGFQGYHSSPYWNPSVDQFDYDNRRLRQNSDNNLNVYNPNYFSPLYPNYEAEWLRASSGVTQYNPSEWWKYMSPSRSDADVTIQRSLTFPTRTTTLHSRRRRNAELVKAAATRTLTGTEALRIALGLANEDASAERPRRQAGNTEELCRVRTQFITPRAALNNKGNWRYVVNMPDNMTQLVRAEICSGATGPIIIICKQRAGADGEARGARTGGCGVAAGVRGAAGGGAGRHVTHRHWPPAGSCVPAPVRRRPLTRLHALFTPASQHAHRRDRDLQPFLFIFRARPSGRFVFRSSETKKKRSGWIKRPEKTGAGRTDNTGQPPPQDRHKLKNKINQKPQKPQTKASSHIFHFKNLI